MPRRWIVLHWRIVVRLEYLHGTLHRIVRHRSLVRTGGRPLRMAGVPDPVDSRVGVRSLLLAQQRIYHARVPGTPLQPALRSLFGGNFLHRLHLHEDFCAALRRERGALTRPWLEAVGD